MRRLKRKAAQMQPSAAEDTDEPPARKLPMVRTTATAVGHKEGLHCSCSNGRNFKHSTALLFPPKAADVSQGSYGNFLL